MDIRIPFLAEGVESGTVVKIFVSPGSCVKKDDPVLELETNKATAPIPSPAAGLVTKVHVQEGQEVSVGQVVISMQDEPGTGSAAGQVLNRPEQPKPVPVRTGTAEARPSKSGFPPPASPTVRKMAGELGIDLSRVRGSERGGRITIEDLRRHIAGLEAGQMGGPARPPAPSKPVDFAKWGPVTRAPLSALRKKIAQRMVESWTQIPHVTQFDEADVTVLMALRKKYAPVYELKGARLTLTAILLSILTGLLKQFPVLNSSLDESTQELISKHYYHLGIAVDTEAGLIVPVLRDVDQKSLLDIAVQLAALSEKTRQRKVSIEDLQGGTFTVSNLGGIGGTHFTPIINRPEAAILGVGRALTRPAWAGAKPEERILLPLALSYDHRIVDGADGARFMKALVERLEHFSEEELTAK